MSDSTISQLPPAVTANATDLIPVDQGGVTKKMSLQMAGGVVGSFPPTVDYPMAAHKFTGMGAGSNPGDSVRYEQVAILDNIPKLAGFVNRNDVSLAWNNVTRTLTIAPVATSFQFYANNILYTKTASEDITIPNITGNYYFHYNAAGVLSVGTSFNNDYITTFAFAASLYWNATTSLAVPDAMFEMHGYGMPTQTHLYLHSTAGTKYDSNVGGLLPSVTVDGDGSLDSHIEFSATPGAIWDDDVQEIISTKALTDNIPVLYRTGAGVWTFDETSPTMVRTTGTGRAAYNQLTGGVWQLTEVTDSNFLLMHLFAIPGFSKKWMLIVGLNQYATIALASEGAASEITTITGIPLSEHKDIASFVIQTDNTYTNSVKSRVVSLTDGSSFIDWRFSEVGGAGASGTGGDVIGPVGAVDNNIVTFDGSTGKIIKDGGVAVTAFARLDGSLPFTGLQQFDSVIKMVNLIPQFWLFESDQPADGGGWIIRINAGVLQILPVTDAGSGLLIAGQISRTGVWSSIPSLSTTTCLAVGGATPSTSGAGITFPASQNPSTDANTLDDYEKGTFTPNYALATPGTSSFGTYAGRAGYYTKIGNKVTAWIFIICGTFSLGTGSGALLVTGLPFTNNGTIQGGGAMINANAYVTLTPTHVRISAGVPQADFRNAAGATYTGITHVNCATALRTEFTVEYFI